MTDLPTLYEYYTSGGVNTGLSDDDVQFTLNGKHITLYSGAIHYFRVHPIYWKNQLRKLRACGFNAVETYVPWNLHEPEKDVYDFGQGESDFRAFLNVKEFVETAKSEDLFVIIRPGPYICAEWEFGGMPSYLLRYSDMKVRTSNQVFLERVMRYFEQLLAVLTPLQFTKGGPIIAFQIENEYGNTAVEDQPVDLYYLLELKQIFERNGVVELLFTSDTPSNGFAGTIPNVLATANFQEDAEAELTLLKKYQPTKPLMVMEFWTGWFDHWADKHETRSLDQFSFVLNTILAMKSSVNMYMFHGGTNWGFLNGANNFHSDFQFDTTSYDYDAPLTEAGDYTEKYYKAKEIIAKYNIIQTKLPSFPAPTKKVSFTPIDVTEMLSLNDLIKQSTNTIEIENLIPMELLPINNDSGQSYGYILYRKEHVFLPKKAVLRIKGLIRDSVMISVNGILKSAPLASSEDFDNFGYWRVEDGSLNLENDEIVNDATVDLLVLNWGRLNFGALGDFKQYKGLIESQVFLNDLPLTNWLVTPLEFKSSWIKNLTDWSKPTSDIGPHLYRAEFVIEEENDTFIDMRDWKQGIVIVNDFVLARYCFLGPQQTAYLPAPFLKKGINRVCVFEHFTSQKKIKFVNGAIFGEPVTDSI